MLTVCLVKRHVFYIYIMYLYFFLEQLICLLIEYVANYSTKTRRRTPIHKRPLSVQLAFFAVRLGSGRINVTGPAH